MAGDTLARGGVRAQFPPAGNKKTQQEWDAMFEGFDPRTYLDREEAKEAERRRISLEKEDELRREIAQQRSGHADVEAPGVLSVGIGETESN